MAFEKYYLERAIEYLSIQEGTYGPNNDSYIIRMFIEYCKENNYLTRDIVSYLKKFEGIGFLKLLDENVEFCSYLRNKSNIRQFLANKLYEKGLIISNPKVYEINGGQFDTIAHSPHNMISKYASQFDCTNSLLYTHNGKLYRINYSGDNFDVEEIPGESTFIIQNGWSDPDFEYNFRMLSCTDHTVMLVDSQVDYAKVKGIDAYSDTPFTKHKEEIIYDSVIPILRESCDAVESEEVVSDGVVSAKITKVDMKKAHTLSQKLVQIKRDSPQVKKIIKRFNECLPTFDGSPCDFSFDEDNVRRTIK